ncbi:MAG: primosomal protein N' [Candidatus Omnitrophica bacterium CG07_land_8_20_14_0_80_42_15]|uniref:Replication restart protein PriA n=1 Tax=Candidatus Aquitaenariimonas noxiae TaxID=1974741 RepID=A0A2J0KTJ5_9BACT|nr:MAG: primosomal protein N' [Candidatus Omnitrophica bacterium CG07_land_8_20_14_0_80_42_15]
MASPVRNQNFPKSKESGISNGASEPSFAEIALGLPIDKLFDYRIPPELEKEIAVGKRVWVPFQNKRKVGYVVAIKSVSDVENVKTIEEIIDKEPLIDPEILTLSKKIAEYYFASWGQAIEASIPIALKKGKVKMGHRKTKIEGEPYPSEELKLPHTLTGEQEEALAAILKSLEGNKHTTFLLHGITASGKTEIYLRVIKRALELGRSSIVLVPEISLTPQTVERFKSRFGDNIAVLHSKLSEGMRFHEWERIKSGEVKIVVGARSAIFSPVKNLGTIILDEEHETSYKQEEAPRYHAREVAQMRSEIAECPLILGTATPSMESYYKAEKGEFKLLELTKRIDNMVLPKVTIVDMKKELHETRKIAVFSRLLKNKIEEAAQKNEQVILFLNRRGFSTFVNCKKCGFVAKCSKCDSVMVYHFATQKLTCHWCNSSMLPPKICPSCQGNYISYFGLGTEKVEEELRHMLPYTRIERMDTDSTAKKGSHARILGDFKRGIIKVLIGTQMIAKGLDFPNVTLVGVISADTGLNLPDFRASERTFCLLTQVAGRAGRGELGGEVVIQTYAPEHYAVASSMKHDYQGFYAKEIESRRELGLPPFYHMARITLQGRNNAYALDAAEKLSSAIRESFKDKHIFVLGPVPAIVSKLRGRYRWNIMIKGKDPFRLNECLKKILSNYKIVKGVGAIVDVDPLTM